MNGDVLGLDGFFLHLYSFLLLVHELVGPEQLSIKLSVEMMQSALFVSVDEGIHVIYLLLLLLAFAQRLSQLLVFGFEQILPLLD